MQNQALFRLFLAGVLLIECARFHAVLGGGMTDREILKRADEARGNMSGVTWDVRIVSNEKGDVQYQDFYVQARDFDALATTTNPPKYKGSRILMVNRSMWFHKKGISKPVPVSQRQKLQGLAAYGDIPSTNYADDYRSTRLPNQEVDGEPCYAFDLVAKNKARTTYDRIHYWVSISRMVGVKADFFTVSGKLIKKAKMKFENSVKIHGRRQPFISEIDFKDTLRPRIMTTMTFSLPTLRAVPTYIFNLNLMAR